MSHAIQSLRPLGTILVPAVAVIAIVLSRHRPDIREGWTLLAATIQTLLVATLIPGVLDGHVYTTDLGSLVAGVRFSLQADALGVLFALVASSLWLCASIYNVGYVRLKAEHNQTRYFASFAATLAAVGGVAFAANLLTLFIFYELLTVATYPLVTHKETDAARSAGRTYLTYAFGGGVLVFIGILLVYWLVGSLAFTPGGIAALGNADPVFARVAFALLATGFGVKAALMPLHSWLPGAMVAPTPVSGLLHAVAVVKSGVFALTRVALDVYGPETMELLGVAFPLAVVAASTTLLASLLALRQQNLKRLLAYSTVSQLSYIVLGIAVFSPTAITGGLFHIPAHAVMKLGLFLCVGTIYVETHVEHIDGLAGIGRRLPVTMTAFAVCAAGMIGIPFTAGFVSKWYLVLGSLDADVALFAGVLVANGILKVVYFWPVVYQAFFETRTDHDPKPVLGHLLGGRPDKGEPTTPDTVHISDGGHSTETTVHGSSHHDTQFDDDSEWRQRAIGAESSWLLLVPLIILAGGTVVLGILPDSIVAFDLVQTAVNEVVA